MLPVTHSDIYHKFNHAKLYEPRPDEPTFYLCKEQRGRSAHSVRCLYRSLSAKHSTVLVVIK